MVSALHGFASLQNSDRSSQNTQTALARRISSAFESRQLSGARGARALHDARAETLPAVIHDGRRGQASLRAAESRSLTWNTSSLPRKRKKPKDTERASARRKSRQQGSPT